MTGPLSPATDRGPEGAEERAESGTGSTVRDRQILVVGDDLAAAATAGFLEQAGLDPVLASAAGERTRPPVVTVWEPGLTLLERIGLRRPVERRGTSLARLDCRTSGDSWASDGTARPSLVALSRPQLRKLLARHLFARIRTTERPVRSLTPTTSGVRVTFEQGIEEPFDTVVTTDRSLVPERDPPKPTGLHGWAFEWPDEVPAPEAPTEAWAETLAAFTVPHATGTHAQFVAAGRTSPSAAVSATGLADRFGHLFDDVPSPFTALDDGGFEYRRLPRAVPVSLCLGRVALVGPGARTSVPGSCLGASFGIEDAWVIADTLAYGPADTDEALTAYEGRRKQRATALCPRVDDTAGTRVPIPLSPPLARLCAARTLAFSHAIDGQPPELARAVPESL
jgi:2-polyprenyl-6-methoxyphenol hydroxylase-like FAD-dependent oxidoreductase